MISGRKFSEWPMTCREKTNLKLKHTMHLNRFFALLALLAVSALSAQAQLYRTLPDGTPRLTTEGASHFAKLALTCVGQEFPNKTGHVQRDAQDLRQPSDYHPAFYGCFDWHSSVHGHWMLVRLLREFPDLPEAKEIRAAISRNLTPEKIAAECAYFDREKSFERTYGWAWLLKLAEELYRWRDDPDAREWYEALRPLAGRIEQLYIAFLPRQTYPTRVGTHTNTAFGLSLALDYAATLNRPELREALVRRSMDYFSKDRKGPAAWEPGSADFFSPTLIEAELMTKVLDGKKYLAWLDGFLPGLAKGKPANLFAPAVVSDRADLQLVHLDGLNLSRAWCFLAIAGRMDKPVAERTLRAAAVRHLDAAIPHIAGGNYSGEHWLATFAVYALFM